MKKVIVVITLLTLLSTGIALHAGCWMPESATVKNHYTKKDGGYITIKASGGTYYLRLKGKNKWMWELSKGTIEAVVMSFGLGLPAVPVIEAINARQAKLFVPTGMDVKHLYQSPPNKPLLTLIKRYWPYLENVSVHPSLSKEFPCYITTTDAAFERWKKNYFLKKQYEKEKEAKQKKEEEKRKEKETEEKRKRQKELKQIHEQ